MINWLKIYVQIVILQRKRVCSLDGIFLIMIGTAELIIELALLITPAESRRQLSSFLLLNMAHANLKIKN